MEKELFGAIRDNYYQASDELWWWLKKKHVLLRIVVFPWILIATSLMRIFGFIFSLGVFLDKISLWLQEKREWFIDKLEDTASDASYSKTSYLATPFIALAISPLALILGLVPKWSSTLAVGLHPDVDISTGTEYGYFTKLGKSYLHICGAMLKSINANGLLFSPIALVVAIVSVPIIIIVALVFYALIVLDMLGWIVSLIRKFVVSSSSKIAENSGSNGFNAVAMPLLLTIFVPIYIALLLIPKIATHEMGQSA